jgi:outer membrane protein TolC
MELLKINMKYTFLALSLFVSGALSAQETRSITINDAIRLGLQNSKQLKVSDARVQEAAAAYRDAQNKRYPDLNVSGAFLRMKQPDMDLKVNLGGAQDTGNAGAQQNEQPLKINQAAYLMANASLPLFSGFRIQNSIRSAQYLKKASELDAQHDQDAVIQNTIEAYYNLYKAQAAVRLVQENLKQAQSRVADFTNMEKNGILARNDLLKSQLQESNVSLTLLDAQNNESITNFNLNLMLGIEGDTKLELTSNPDTTMKTIPGLAQLEQTTFDHRADYKAMQQREAAAHAGIRAAKGAYFPSLALTGGYVALDVPDLVTVTNAINVGLGLRYNIADLYKNGSRVKAAKAREQQTFWALQQMNDGLRMQIHQSYQNYIERLKKIEVYQKAVDQAAENYRITRNKYDNALATTTDLLDADVSQLQARMNYEFARADAMTAYSKLMETAGVLQEKISQ